MSNVARLPQQQILEPLDIFSFGQFHEPKPVEWLIEGWIPRRCAVLFTGSVKLGKTYILQHLMLCAALGKPWLGLPIAQTRSLAFLCEDEFDWIMHRRDCILRHLEADETDVDEIATGAARRGCTNWL